MKVLLKSFGDYFKDDGPMLAGSISYFFVMAIFPFCLFLVSVLGYLIGENRAFYDFLLKELVRFFPAAAFKITRELAAVITYKKIGILTLLIYGFFSYQLFQALERAINSIFKEKVKRSFLRSAALSLMIVTLIIALIIISFGATSAISMLKYFSNYFPGLVIKNITKILIGFIIPMVLVSLIATALYILLPNKRVMTGHALAGGLFTAFFLEAAKHLFTFYLASKLSDLGAIYGPLTAFVIFVLWIFYSASIFLIGGEVVHNIGMLKES
ncbi:MAG: YihY/virulence factor BrkB family protein [Nitrospira sp.]|nr:YihY/virulence factor BrkB family protein [Nitrospira sp.]